MYWMCWGEGWREEEWPGNVSLFHGLIWTAVFQLQLAVADCSCCPAMLLEGNSWAINSFGLYAQTLKLGTISAFEKVESFSYLLRFWRPTKHWWMSESGWGEVLPTHMEIYFLSIHCGHHQKIQKTMEVSLVRRNSASVSPANIIYPFWSRSEEGKLVQL